jgi:NADPH-dependent 2,4-dienoyl-CoA reductase/sulfur reductase-like enzyme/rhodanese-related sulfurtransferase
MRIIIIGGVAAGTSVAAKLRRNDEKSEIIIYERGQFISYSTCGMPYLIGRDEISAQDLVPRDPKWFAKRFQIDIKTGHEVISLAAESRSIEVKDLETGATFTDHYDELVLATGSQAVIPPIKGIDQEHVFTVKTMEDTLSLEKYLEKRTVSDALVIGAGFIGLEIFENLINRGISTRLVEAKTSLMPLIDDDMSPWIEDYCEKNKLQYALGELVERIEETRVTTKSGNVYPADLVIIAAGVRAETSLALSAGIALGKSGAIQVDEKMNTSIKHIKAVGDCAEVWSLSTGNPMFRPMGSTANKMGRIAGDSLSGGNLAFRGVLGTGIVKFFDLYIGLTGLTHFEAEKTGMDVEIIHNIKENQSKYLPESREMIIKALADRKTGKLLGVQIIGEKGVDKRLDVFVTAITFGATVDDLFHLDLSYAPPVSSTKDPVMYTGMILSNAIYRNRKIVTPEQLLGHESEYQIIDVRSPKDYEKGSIEGAENIPLAKLRENLHRLKKNRPTITHCNKGVSGNTAQNLLLNSGFNEVYNISGGYKNYKMFKAYRG